MKVNAQTSAVSVWVPGLVLTLALVLTLTLGNPVSVLADATRPDQVNFPLDDAKAAYQQDNYEFVAIKLKDKTLVPGMKQPQLARIKAEYQLRLLNQRWQTYGNIEQQPKRLARLKSYALRYNLALWKLIHHPHRQQKAFKYRY